MRSIYFVSNILLSGLTFTFCISERNNRHGMDGPKGDPGVPGEQGPRGLPGASGMDGKDGKDGKDGIGIYRSMSELDAGCRQAVSTESLFYLVETDQFFSCKNKVKTLLRKNVSESDFEKSLDGTWQNVSMNKTAFAFRAFDNPTAFSGTMICLTSSIKIDSSSKTMLYTVNEITQSVVLPSADSINFDKANFLKLKSDFDALNCQNMLVGSSPETRTVSASFEILASNFNVVKVSLTDRSLYVRINRTLEVLAMPDLLSVPFIVTNYQSSSTPYSDEMIIFNRKI